MKFNFKPKKISQSLFRGKVGKVNLTVAKNEKDALGYFGRTSVYVRNGQRAFYEEENPLCLVRFNLKSKKNYQLPAAHFISRDFSKVPSNNLLRESEYILFGEFPIENGKIPSIGDINNFYDPGNMPQVFYFNSLSEYYSVDFKFPTKKITNPLTDLIKYKFSFQAGKSKVFIFRNRKDLNNLSNILKDDGILPIEMEPLVPFNYLIDTLKYF